MSLLVPHRVLRFVTGLVGKSLLRMSRGQAMAATPLASSSVPCASSAA